MKKLTQLVALVLFCNVIKAQVPAFPSVDAAFAKVLLANYDEEIFKATGLHANKFKMLAKKEAREWNEKYTEENSYFSSYPTSRCKELYWQTAPNYPDDECHIMFSANSPKVGNEEYYSVVFEVIYSRMKNSVLTNTWEFKWVIFGGHYVLNRKGLDGKLMIDNAVKALMQTKGAASKISYETVNLDGNNYIFYFDFKDFSTVDSIVFRNNQISNGGYYLDFYGTFQNFQYGDNCLPSYAGTKKLVAKVSVETKEGKVVETQLRDDFGSSELTNIKGPKEGFKTSEELTFAQLYKKAKQPKCESAAGVAFKYESVEDRKAKFVECLKSILADEKQLKNPEKIKEYLPPNDDGGYDKFVALFKALEDQGYGWRNVVEKKETFKYEIYGRKLINKLYKEEKTMYYDIKTIKDVTYFELRP